MIIDIHTHIFSDEICRDRSEYLSDENFSHLYSSEKARLVDHKILIETMDNSSVDYAVALGFSWKDKKFCEMQNDYFSDLNRITNGRLLPFGSVPLDEQIDIDGWVKDIKEKGLFGIGEIGFYTGGIKDQYTNYLNSVLEAAGKYSLPVMLHVNEPVGHEYCGKYNPLLDELYRILSRFPDLNIIFAHWGGGLLFYELMPEIRKNFSNFYYDTAASPYLYRDDIYKISVDITGSEKILLGSDFPLLDVTGYITSIKDSGLSDNARENILGLNAAKLFGLSK